MHRAVSIFMAALLLTQIASYSFNEIPPQIEWEEPMQGDKDWKVSGRNNTSGNNTGGNNTGGNNTGGNNSSSNTTSPTGNIYITMYGYYSLTPSSYYESGYWWPSSTVSADFNSILAITFISEGIISFTDFISSPFRTKDTAT